MPLHLFFAFILTACVTHAIDRRRDKSPNHFKPNHTIMRNSNPSTPDQIIGAITLLPTTSCTDSCIDKGVASPFAGHISRHIIIAGGCNFPHRPVVEGGKKVFYQDIYTVEIRPDDNVCLHPVGQMPQPLAYGAAASDGTHLYCMGGNNGHSATDQVFGISMIKDKAQVHMLPSLPQPMDNIAADMHEGIIYVVGGNMNGHPSNAVFALDLKSSSPCWKALPDFPGNPRTQCTAIVLKDRNGHPTLYVFGGFAPRHGETAPTLNTDGLALDLIEQKWRHLPQPMSPINAPISLGGGAVTKVDAHQALFVGGVNPEIFLNALTQPDPLYLTHPASWYRLNEHLCIYNAQTEQWDTRHSSPHTARAGAAIVRQDNDIYLIQGELKPGVRTPHLTRIKIHP